MKIAYVITRSDVMGGASVHLLDLAAGVQSLGHDVIIYVGGRGVVNEMAERRGISCVSLLHLVRKIHPLDDAFCFFELRRKLKLYEPDVVHLHSSKAGIIGRLVASSLGLPSVFTVHGWAFTEGVSKSRRKFYRAIERLMARFTTKIITVSDYDRDLALISKVGNSELIKTVHNGIPSTVEVGLKNKLGPVRFIMVARFEEPKAHIVLIEAFSRVVSKNWLLEFVGSGPLLGSVRKRVDELGLSQNVVFSGERNDVEERLRAADVFCLVSKWEGFPLTILEAMRAGLPVVASDVGGVSEAVLDGETGYLVPKDDPFRLSKILDVMIGSVNGRASLGHNGRIRFVTHFRAEKMLESTMDVYHEVCK